MRTLIVTPIHESKDYVIREWLEHMQQFYWCDHLLIDNSPSDWGKQFTPHHISPFYKDKKLYPFQLITMCQNFGRKVFLENGYDYFFSVECDNFPDVDDLLEMQAWIDTGYHNVNMPYVSPNLSDDISLTVQDWILPRDHPYMGAACERLEYYGGFELMDGEPHKIAAPAIGTSVFSKELMMLQSFRVREDNPDAFSDTFWHLDAYDRGGRFQPILLTHKLIRHDYQNWKYLE